jgi:four helix bundle protein
MATIKTFEDLEIWKNAHDLGKDIFNLCETNLKIQKDFSFKDQIKRATLSISNNISEGFEYSNNRQFYRFLAIAKGSCGEVRNCLLFLISINYSEEKEVEALILKTRILSGQIGNFMKYLNKLNNESKLTK